jgi:2-aminobenzoate-CoA ligase
MSAHVDTFVRDNLPPAELWPELTLALPELDFPATYNASSILDAALAKGFAERPAVLCGSTTLSYEALLCEASRIAHVLTHDFGLVPGNRVLIHASNTRLSIAVWWGVFRAGGVAVGTMPMLRAHELAVILNKAQISHAIVDAHRVAELEQAGAEAPSLKHIVATDDLERRLADADDFPAIATAADDAVLIAFTSGTTGAPKGCVHFHRDIAAMAETFSRRVLQPKPTDVFIGTPPLAFTFGLGAGVVFPASVGAATVVCDKPGFDVLADTIARHGATTLFTSPTGYRALMKQDLSKLSSLHTCVSAGEHLPRATSDQWFERTGVRIIDGIGSTEMIHIFISARGDDIRPGATGKAVPGYEATLLDENDQPFGGEGEGRLAVRGPTGCRYLADERQKSYVINGWNVTGDLYRRDADGYFWYLSRADDMIISSGYNIGAPEVENALLTHPLVAEAAVIGAPDEERGHIVKAFVVLKPEAEASAATARALQDHVKQTIAPYKYPRAVEFVRELPKTHTGKLQRFKLREQS